MKKAHLFLLAAPALTGWALWGNYDVDIAEHMMSGPSEEYYGYSSAAFGKSGKERLVAIGAPEGDRVFIYHQLGDISKEVIIPDSAWVFEGESGGEAGWSLADGDLVAKDGVVDLVIGAPSEAGGKGHIYIIDGASINGDIGPEDAAHVINGSVSEGYTGWGLAVGDFDWDGNQDLAFSSPSANSGDGLIHIAYGPFEEGGETEADDLLTLSGPEGNSATIGRSMSAGDFDGDFHDDLVIGSTFGAIDFDENDNSGRLYVIYELPDEDTPLDDVEEMARIFGSHNLEGAGYTVSLRGDLNQDGGDDLVFSAPYQSCLTNYYRFNNPVFCGLFDRGRVYVVLADSKRLEGDLDAKTIADIVIESTSRFDFFGVGLSSYGSINGDFKHDLIIGAPNDSEAFVFYGDGDWVSGGDQILLSDVDADVIISADKGQLGFSSLATIDFNEDDVGDFLLTAPGNPWVYESDEVAPAAYVIFGQD